MQRHPLVPLGPGPSKCASLTASTFLLTLLVSSGCDQDEPVDIDDSPALAGTTAGPDDVAPGDMEVVELEPDLVLDFGGGASLGFLLDDDGSVGLIEQVPKGAGVASVLDDPWLQDASPAVLWYALTPDGTQIPEPLRIHHEELAAIGQLLPLEEALAAQVRNLAPVPLADDEDPCVNATFQANHCAHPDYDFDNCFLNDSGDLNTAVYQLDRFKAGFCLQEGEARSWLYFWPGVGATEEGCVYIRTANFVWGANSFNLGTRFAAPTYFNHVWWRGAGAARRAYFHRAIGDPGSVFDYGTRWSWSSCDE